MRGRMLIFLASASMAAASACPSRSTPPGAGDRGDGTVEPASARICYTGLIRAAGSAADPMG